MSEKIFDMGAASGVTYLPGREAVDMQAYIKFFEDNIYAAMGVPKDFLENLPPRPLTPPPPPMPPTPRIVVGIDWGNADGDRTVGAVMTNEGGVIRPLMTLEQGKAPWVSENMRNAHYEGLMREALYTYRRERRADGTEEYRRVPYDPSAPVTEPPVTMPNPPQQRNGEVPGSGSVAVDAILRRAVEAEQKRQAAAAAAAAEEEAKKPVVDHMKPRRKIEV